MIVVEVTRVLKCDGIGGDVVDNVNDFNGLGLVGVAFNGTIYLVIKMPNGKEFKPCPCIGVESMNQFKGGGEFLSKVNRDVIFHINGMLYGPEPKMGMTRSTL